MKIKSYRYVLFILWVFFIPLASIVCKSEIKFEKRDICIIPSSAQSNINLMNELKITKLFVENFNYSGPIGKIFGLSGFPDLLICKGLKITIKDETTVYREGNFEYINLFNPLTSFNRFSTIAAKYAVKCT
jgi:hypothetical protein